MKVIIVLALLLAGLQTEAQQKPRPKKANTVWNDDWETPMVKKNKAKAGKAAGIKSAKRKTKM